MDLDEYGFLVNGIILDNVVMGKIIIVEYTVDYRGFARTRTACNNVDSVFNAIFYGVYLSLKMGFDQYSRFRISAAISHILQESANRNGHTYLPRGEVVICPSCKSMPLAR